MQFKAIVLGLATFFVTAQACGCHDPSTGNRDEATSKACCNANGASWSNGDCAADSMSESLRDYDSCCQEGSLISDCDYPDPIGDILG